MYRMSGMAIKLRSDDEDRILAFRLHYVIDVRAHSKVIGSRICSTKKLR
jgi:hypothetical protein